MNEKYTNDEDSEENDIDVYDAEVENQDEDASSSIYHSQEHTPQYSGRPTLKKRGIISRLIALILGILTLGLSFRIFPACGRRTWFFSMFIFLVLAGYAIVDRYFYDTVNERLETYGVDQYATLPNTFVFDQWLNSRYQLRLAADPALTIGSSEQPKKTTSARAENEEIQRLRTEVESLKTASQKRSVTRSATTFSQSSIPMISLYSLDEAAKDVGCHSKFSVEKSTDIYQQRYNDRWMRWNGSIEHVESDHIQFSNGGQSVKVFFENAGEGYELLKGDTVSVTLKLDKQGSCSDPFEGQGGLINEIIK